MVRNVVNLTNFDGLTAEELRHLIALWRSCIQSATATAAVLGESSLDVIAPRSVVLRRAVCCIVVECLMSCDPKAGTVSQLGVAGGISVTSAARRRGAGYGPGACSAAVISGRRFPLQALFASRIATLRDAPETSSLLMFDSQ